VEKKPERFVDEEINLIDYLIIVLKRKWLIVGGTFGFACLIGVLVFLMPNKYVSESRFLPPQQGNSSATAAMLSQLGQGASEIAGSLLGMKIPGDMYVGLLNSRTIIDKIIDRFDLMKRYEPDRFFILRLFRYRRDDARKKLRDDVMTAAADEKSGIVSISILDQDPKVAAEMTNAFVDELKVMCKGLAITEAAQRRLFFEDQLKDTKANLVKAENEMRGFQEKTGVLQVEAQSQAVIQGIAAVSAQIAAKEVEIKVMKTYSSPSNPDLQRAEESLRSLKVELAKLETKGGSGHDPLMPTGRMPSVEGENVRKLRDLKFNETLYELLIKQYEAAKMDEARDAVVIQVVDRAVPSEKPAKPKRILLILVAIFVGFFLSIFATFGFEMKERASKNPDNTERMEMLRKYAHLRSRK
jgi:tyrosine-protein kinase Etk/Wzc